MCRTTVIHKDELWDSADTILWVLDAVTYRQMDLLGSPDIPQCLVCSASFPLTTVAYQQPRSSNRSWILLNSSRSSQANSYVTQPVYHMNVCPFMSIMISPTSSTSGMTRRSFGLSTTCGRLNSWRSNTMTQRRTRMLVSASSSIIRLQPTICTLLAWRILLRKTMQPQTTPYA